MVNNIALIEPKKTGNRFEFSFEFDRYALCSDPSTKKVLKKNVDININLDDYQYIILVGSESLKEFTKQTAITQYTGRLIDGNFLPLISPGMLSFNPNMRKVWDESVKSIENIIESGRGALDIKSMAQGITDLDEAKDYVQAAIDCKEFDHIGLDSETAALYPRDGHMLGFSLCYEPGHGAYVDCTIIDEELEEMMQELFNKKRVVFHNAKFDVKFFEYHFNFKFNTFDDTMLMHYILDENSPHGLKYLAIRYTEYGDYEQDLHEWMASYCKTHGVKKSDFCWDVIPFDTMYPYAALDSVVTFELFIRFYTALNNNAKLMKVYKHLMIPACRFLCNVEQNGIPFNEDRLRKSEVKMEEEILQALDKLYLHPEIRQFELENKNNIKDGTFNPNSVIQLRALMFDYLGLKPTGKKTAKGMPSTDAEVLKDLSLEHEVPGLILDIRQKGKMKNTYLSKIIPALDRDKRLRTNFNQHVTTSGRLSSSGKLNAQQLPRDNPLIKGCIQATEGNSIVSMDLKTAEMYYAAILSGDRALIQKFVDGVNLHSSVAKDVFKLPCAESEVDTLYKRERTATKAINFGVIYGAMGWTISSSIYKDTGFVISPQECDEYIRDYFKAFSGLKKWLTDTQDFIAKNGFIYSHFGRKRRLVDVASGNQAQRSHAIRSGLNFVIQSVASDVNVLGGMEMDQWINANKFPAKIFALVHDSVLAEVRDDCVEEYNHKLKFFVQKDRGISIPGCPVGCDFEIGKDYSFGKFEKTYPEIA